MKIFGTGKSWSRLSVGGIMAMALAIWAASPAFAESPGEHPNYLHSRSDLRMAEALLRYTDEPGVMHKLERAADSIHLAIGDLDRAIAIDRKGEFNNPPVDVPKLGRTGRLTEIKRLLNAAMTDLQLPEDKREARESRRMASEHIRSALAEVESAMREFREDHPPIVEHPVERHPHYLRALADLRYARALLDRHGEGEWNRDRERMGAVTEIERAIAEIKRAALDDGKNLDDHPMVDYAGRHHDRLLKASEALKSALENLDFEEDDLAASGWRNAARRHVSEARHMVDTAMRE